MYMLESGMAHGADSLSNARQHTADEAAGDRQENHDGSGAATGLTPRMVLQSLPGNATPAQQDSAIQANFKPSAEHISTRPDTLRMPFDTVVAADGKKPFFEESFFASDSMFHPELSGGRYGVSGAPVPYNMRGDDLITGLLLACFVLGMIAFSRSRDFIFRQTRNFFRVRRSNTTAENETTSEMRFQFFLVFVAGLLLSLLAFFYVEETVSDPLVLKSHYTLIAIFLASCLAYFLLKAMLYTIVDSVFFNMAANAAWLKSLLFLTGMAGVLLFPAVVLLIYFNMHIETALVYAATVLLAFKTLSFYKCYVTFFRDNGYKLQIFLYFCTLEIVPLLALAGGGVMIVNNLKIN